jgi:hypothetical protein
MLSRALDLLWRYGVSIKKLPDLVHGDLLVFSLVSAEIM